MSETTAVRVNLFSKGIGEYRRTMQTIKSADILQLEDAVQTLRSDMSRLEQLIAEHKRVVVSYMDAVNAVAREFGVLKAQSIIRKKRGFVDIASIKEVVANAFGLDPNIMHSRRRPAEIARPRMMAMYLAKELSGKTLMAIGREFRRDHGTILHACKTISEEVSKNENTATMVRAIEKLLVTDAEPPPNDEIPASLIGNTFVDCGPTRKGRPKVLNAK